MPKKYQHGKRGKTMTYNTEQLEKAVNAVNAGSSVRQASEMFGVPRSTIGDRVSGRFDITSEIKHGRPQAVPEEIEQKIVKSVKMASQLGFGLSRKQILQRTNVLCQRIKLKTSYTNFKAGKDWWQGVKRRYPELAIRKPERLSSVRARMMNREVVGRYFEDLHNVITELNLNGHSDRIWNCDETGLNFEHCPVRVVAEKGQRSVISKTSNKSSNITIMACINGAGHKMPPMIITKGKTSKSLHGFRTNDAPDQTLWSYQPSGWISDDIGEQWFNNVFMQHCGSERPQLLILDGHSSHETLAIIERAIEENITLISLPPHCTHYLQPLDRSVFGPFKKAYNAACSDFMSENPLHVINKWSFPSIFKTAWDRALSYDNIVSGFAACGICPFHRDAVPTSAFSPSKPTDIPENVNKQDDQVQLAHHTEELVTPSLTIQDISTGLPREVSDTFIVDESLSTVTVASSNVRESVSDICVVDTTYTGVQPASNEDASQTYTDLPVVLDISDPSQLLELIKGGEFLVEPLSVEQSTCESGDFVVEPLKVGQSICESNTLNNTIDSNIADLYLPAQLDSRPNMQSSRPKNTSHRILTSEEIYKEKLESKRIKLEKENKKQIKKNKAEKENKKVVKKVKRENIVNM